MLFLVATTSLPAVDRWNATLSCQFGHFIDAWQWQSLQLPEQKDGLFFYDINKIFIQKLFLNYK